MSKNKKKIAKVPKFIDIVLSQRIQITTPRGNFHTDQTKYNRKQKHKKSLED